METRDEDVLKKSELREAGTPPSRRLSALWSVADGKLLISAAWSGSFHTSYAGKTEEMKCKVFGCRVSDFQHPLQILFWDTSERLLAAAQLVYDINHLWSLLAIWLHVKDKKVSSQELDISRCTLGSVAPFGNVEHAIDVGGRTRGRLTVWLMEKKSSGRKWNNRTNVVFTEFEETWRIWTVAESPGETQTDVFVWVLREEGRRGEAQVWFITNQGLTVAAPSKNWHKHRSGITCHLPERSDPSYRTPLHETRAERRRIDKIIVLKDVTQQIICAFKLEAVQPWSRTVRTNITRTTISHHSQRHKFTEGKAIFLMT